MDARKATVEIDTSVFLKDFGMDKEKIEAVKAKIIDSEKFNFNKEEIELIYKLTGFDLLTASEMRAALLLFSGLPSI